MALTGRGCGHELRPGVRFCTICEAPHQAPLRPPSVPPGPPRRLRTLLLGLVTFLAAGAITAAVMLIAHPLQRGPPRRRQFGAARRDGVLLSGPDRAGTGGPGPGRASRAERRRPQFHRGGGPRRQPVRAEPASGPADLPGRGHVAAGPAHPAREPARSSGAAVHHAGRADQRLAELDQGGSGLSRSGRRTRSPTAAPRIARLTPTRRRRPGPMPRPPPASRPSPACGTRSRPATGCPPTSGISSDQDRGAGRSGQAGPDHGG